MPLAPLILSASEDPRPSFRVAAFGFSQAMQQVAEIVFAHARHNPYRYQVAQDTRLDACDVALIDMTVRGNERLLRVLRNRAGSLPVLTVGRRGASSRLADDLLIAQFATRLLDVLNVAVARQLALKRQKAIGIEPARGPAVLDARVLWGRAPRALVLDASTPARMQLMSRLAGAGWEVQGAASIAQARVWLTAWPPEIVVSDWALDDGEARGLWRQGARSPAKLQEQGARGSPDWLLLTPRPSWWRLLLARWSGCAAVLDKPTTPRAVLAVMDRLLRERLT
jgi:hypothetical protein